MRSGAVGTTATPAPICRLNPRRRSAYRERCVAASIVELSSAGRPGSSARLVQRGEALRRPDVVPDARVQLAADAPLSDRLDPQRQHPALGAALHSLEELGPV